MSNEVMSPQAIRVERAKAAVDAYAAVSGGGSFDEVISDLLADLMHYVDHIELVEYEGQDFNDLINRAEFNYTYETEEDNA